MLFQDFVGSIIGSFLATIGSILTWVIIEIIKKSIPKTKLKRNIKKLYEEFAKKELEPYMSIRMSTLIGDIGKQKFLTILKLTLIENPGGYALTSEDFIIQVVYTHLNEISIRYGPSTYHYAKPDENQDCLHIFLKYYEEQCKLEKIKLKKPKRLKN